MARSTISYYHRRRLELLKQVSGHHVPVCEDCGVPGYEGMHVHHPKHCRGTRSGGWQALYEHEDDLENDRPLVVLCEACHDHADYHKKKYQKGSNARAAIIDELHDGAKTISELQDNIDRDDVADGLNFLKQQGVVFEPKPGLVVLL